MLVLVREAAEPVMPVEVQLGSPVRVSDQFRQWDQRPGVGDALMRPMVVVEDLVLAQRAQQCRGLKIKVRSSSSRRQVRTQRSITALIRGTRTPLRTTAIPASARTESNKLGSCRPGRESVFHSASRIL
jgi:hypothetical protein